MSPRSLHLVLTSRLENLGVLGAATRGIAREYLRDEAQADFVELAAVEICSNIIRHGHPDDPQHTFTIDVIVDGALELEIRDDGPPFAFQARELPTSDCAIENLPTGGYGIGIVHASMDGVTYCRDGGTNIIRLVKKLG